VRASVEKFSKDCWWSWLFYCEWIEKHYIGVGNNLQSERRQRFLVTVL